MSQVHVGETVSPKLPTWHVHYKFFVKRCRLLGLDLVVRDEEGNVLNPETASVIKIYREVS